MKFDEFNPAQGFEALAREYWSRWGDFARQSGGAQSTVPGWQQAVDWWSQLAHGGREEANTVVEQFNKQSAHWFGLMQSVAAQFADQHGSATDVARAWQKAVGAQGENPFPEMFRGLRGKGVAGLDQWVEDASPFLDAWRKEAGSLLSMPTFGLAREHQERWQAMQRAQLSMRQSQSAYAALLAKAGQRAFEIFEAKLEERSEPGRALESARALFDLWIDAAEEGYGEIALSPEFRRAYGQMVNDQMRLRKSVQDEVERFGTMIGLPSRSEVDASHRKLHAVEKEVHRLKAHVASLLAAAANASTAASATRRPTQADEGRAATLRPAAKPAQTAATRSSTAGSTRSNSPSATSQGTKSSAARPSLAARGQPARRTAAAGKSQAASRAKTIAKPATRAKAEAKPRKAPSKAKPMISLSRTPVRPGADSGSNSKTNKASKRGSAKR